MCVFALDVEAVHLRSIKAPAIQNKYAGLLFLPKINSTQDRSGTGEWTGKFGAETKGSIWFTFQKKKRKKTSIVMDYHISLVQQQQYTPLKEITNYKKTC